MSHEPEIDEQESTEQTITSRQAFAKLLPFLNRHRRGLSFCLLLLAVSTAFSLYWPILLKNAVDIDIKNGDLTGLLLTVILIAVSQTATLYLQYVQRIKLEIIGQDIMVELKR